MPGFAAVPKSIPFAKSKIQQFKDFSGGLNNKFSPLLIADNELQSVENFHYDQKGTLQKRTGFTKHYTAAFGSGPVRGLYNYRKDDGTSKLIIACDGKLLYDTPQFTRLWTLQTDWDFTGTTKVNLSSAQVSGDIGMLYPGLGMMEPGAASAQLGAPVSLPAGTWTSEVQDLLNVTNQGSGTATIVQTLPTSTTLTFQTRTDTQSSMATASAWTNLGVGNTIVSPANRYLQVRIQFTSTSGNTPTVQSLQVNFDQTPSTSTLATGLSTTARYQFATQLDTLYIVNGVNNNKKWDGTTYADMGGTPPTGTYIIVHKNRMFIAGNTANPSRLYFSDLLTPESWPALNFIDVGKGDGDQITGMYVLLDQLVITKNASVWLLQGDAPANFVLRRTLSEQGAIAGQSFAPVRNTMAMLSRDGVRFFDGVRSALASEKVTTTFNGLNQRQLQQVAAVTFLNHIYFAVPEGTSTTNTVVMVFDILRTAWTLYRGPLVGEWVIWRQQNADKLLFGSAVTGQVYDAWTTTTAYSDDGVAISAFAKTKATDLGGAETLKFAKSVYVIGAAADGGTANPTLAIDKDQTGDSATIPVAFSTPLNEKRTTPSTVGVSTFRTIAMKLAHNELNVGISAYGLSLEYTVQGIRPG